MRLLFCCEFYYPSIGGVQEVMRQLAERLVQRGHDVCVATTRLPARAFSELNGVRIEEFDVRGNAVRGMEGEVERYRDFVMHANADAILVKAAQQWTFDALWPVLDRITARKVFIPCGFSSFYQASYTDYFRRLPHVLRSFDHLIFYASRYRDIDYVRSNGMDHFTIIPNGASEIEFEEALDSSFRSRHGIEKESFVFLTVGSLTGMKGHLELAKAFYELDTKGRPVTLILNGNNNSTSTGHGFVRHIKALREALSARGWRGIRELPGLFLLRRMPFLYRVMEGTCLVRFLDPLQHTIRAIRKKDPLKQVFLLDLPRNELVQAYKNADLFVFASNVEYSPLVLFESAAAGTPFLSVPVGNAEEIAKWTECGIICPAAVDSRGYTRVNPGALAKQMEYAMSSPDLLKELGQSGYQRWKEKYSWSKIVVDYEDVLAGKTDN